MTHLGLIEVHWLPRLRWAAVLALLAAIAATRWLMHAPFPIEPMIAVVVVLALVNVALLVHLRRTNALSERAITANLLVDTMALTALLVWTGGAMNPFTTLYLLQVALSAVLVGRAASLLVSIVSVLCFGALFVVRPEAIHLWHSASMFDLHVRGMWIAFALTAGALWYFIGRVSTALRARDRELADAQLRAQKTAAQSEKLASVATLAAGAAHELNTPLGTVMILAAELRDTLSKDPDAQATLRAMREQLARCKTILARMRPMDESEMAIELVELGPWIRAAVDRWRAAHPGAEVTLRDELGEARALISCVSFEMALSGVLDNARRAHEDAARAEPIALELSRVGDERWITVIDRAASMSPEVAARASEPFFSTREAGEGMGLGLYLTRSTVERVGGRLVLDPRGDQTRVSLVLPVPAHSSQRSGMLSVSSSPTLSSVK